MGAFERVQCLALFVFATFCLPATTILALLNFIIVTLSLRSARRWFHQLFPDARSKVIVLSGANTSAGLQLARIFTEAGHRVVGTDLRGLVPGRANFSNSVAHFRSLPLHSEDTPHGRARYIASLVRVIDEACADLWINCSIDAPSSADAHAQEIIEQSTKCRCFSMRLRELARLQNPGSFLEYLASLSLPVPESYTVTSRNEIHNVLSKASGKRRYLLQSQETSSTALPAQRLGLPKRTLSQTYNEISKIDIAAGTPWRLGLDTTNMERFSTFSVIIGPTLKAFCATSVKQDGSLELRDSRSGIGLAMLIFMQRYAQMQSDDFASHLSVEFCVDENVKATGMEQLIMPVRASANASPALLFLADKDTSSELVDIYLSALHEPQRQNGLGKSMPVEHSGNEAPRNVLINISNSGGVHCLGQSFVQHVLGPIVALVNLATGMRACLRGALTFLQLITLSKDDTYDFHDPLPFWWTYQVYIPLQLLARAVWGSTFTPRLPLLGFSEPLLFAK